MSAADQAFALSLMSALTAPSSTEALRRVAVLGVGQSRAELGGVDLGDAGKLVTTGTIYGH